MRHRGYAIAFAGVLLLACVGGFFGGRLLLERVQQDFAPRAGWTPQAPTPAGQVSEQSAPPVAPTSAAQSPRSTAATLVAPTPAGVPPAVLPPTETPASVAGPATPGLDGAATLAPSATETASPIPSPRPAFPYVLARAVRHTTGDCAGKYVLGQVTDRGGSPLPNIRLKLVDEYGNPAIAVSKAGAGDLGRYDFPLFGVPRRFYLTVVDGADQPLSAEVEIRHGLAPNADATCHWVDWRRQ